jgi:hypothetical protein
LRCLSQKSFKVQKIKKINNIRKALSRCQNYTLKLLANKRSKPLTAVKTNLSQSSSKERIEEKWEFNRSEFPLN